MSLKILYLFFRKFLPPSELSTQKGRPLSWPGGLLRNVIALFYFVGSENPCIYSVPNRKQSYDEKSLGIVGKTLNEISSDNAIDYAVYKLPFTINEELTFKCGDSRKSKVGDQVTIIGYPNHQKGNSPYIHPCSITSEKYFQGAPFFTVSGRVVHGASGGIVLNSDHEAIGIIKGGIVSLADDTDNENQGFVPLHLVLDHMKSMTQTQIWAMHIYYFIIFRIKEPCLLLANHWFYWVLPDPLMTLGPKVSPCRTHLFFILLISC